MASALVTSGAVYGFLLGALVGVLLDRPAGELDLSSQPVEQSQSLDFACCAAAGRVQ